ncbi:hypothetical protein LAU_0177 [Lausannevirus]|uniref:Uncharacterized protein n=1 Tax=Lausannevirus TaxID=999883 RepID=F2WLA5_9VIRU|nr:hypothetical protein LAU_0177 [Lausannevirus]AEA07028.1 hypothetical protein LAU_0177 [Lausannevirus]
MHRFLYRKELVSFSILFPQQLEVREFSKSFLWSIEGELKESDATKETESTKKVFSYIKGTKVRHGPFKVKKVTRTKRHNVADDWYHISKVSGFYIRGKLEGIKTTRIFSGEKNRIIERVTTTSEYHYGLLDGVQETINFRGIVLRKILFAKGKFIKNIYVS